MERENAGERRRKGEEVNGIGRKRQRRRIEGAIRTKGRDREGQEIERDGD